MVSWYVSDPRTSLRAPSHASAPSRPPPTAALRGLLAETVPYVVLVGAVGRSAARRFLDDVQDEPLDCRLVRGGAGFMPEDLSRLPAGTVLHEGNYRELAATLAG